MSWVDPGGRCSGWEAIGCAGAEMPWFPQNAPFPPPITPGRDCSLSSVHLLYRSRGAAGSLPRAPRLFDLLLAWRLWGSARLVPAAVASSVTVFLMGSSVWGLPLPDSQVAMCWSCLSSMCQKMFLTTLAALWQLLVAADLIESAPLSASQPAISKFLQNPWFWSTVSS